MTSGEICALLKSTFPNVAFCGKSTHEQGGGPSKSYEMAVQVQEREEFVLVFLREEKKGTGKEKMMGR